jgi:hypothetical protein
MGCRTPVPHRMADVVRLVQQIAIRAPNTLGPTGRNGPAEDRA